jgi:hypothetical protein
MVDGIWRPERGTVRLVGEPDHPLASNPLTHRVLATVEHEPAPQEVAALSATVMESGYLRQMMPLAGMGCEGVKVRLADVTLPTVGVATEARAAVAEPMARL